VLPTVSFVSEIFSGDRYTDDGVRFATKAEALAYEPVNYRWADGKLARDEPAYVPPYAKY